MQSIRWGVLGAGGIANTVVPDIAATEGNVVVAVAARDGARAGIFAEKHGIERAYGGYDQLYADPDIDVIYIATTHGQHHEQALAALNAGKPVLVEKAFTLNARQAREVVALARERKLFCMEGMWMRLHPMVLEAKRLVQDGRIGKVTGVRADLSRLFPYNPEHRLYDPAAGGGALLDLGVYPAHFAWTFLGKPDSVHATGSLAPTGTDVTVAMQWGYQDGRVAQIFCSAAGPSPYTALITGTKGWIRLETRIHRATALTVATCSGEIEGEALTEEVIAHELEPGNGFGHEITEVARCLREGLTESPFVPLNDTVDLLATLDEARAQLGVRYSADEEG
jgi:predicted dehydrogenase